MTKSGFSKKLTDIISSNNCNLPIVGEELDWLIDACLRSKSYKTKALRPNIQIIPRMRKFGPKRQKFLCLVETSGKELVISKSKLIEELYPTKSKLTKEQKHRQTVLASMRYCVSDQILEYKDSLFAKPAVCALSEKPLNACSGGYAIDHIIPFIKLADDWLIQNGLCYDEIKLKGRGHKKYFANPVLWDSWYQYHQENAKLQAVCRSENSRAGSKGYESQYLIRKED